MSKVKQANRKRGNQKTRAQKRRLVIGGGVAVGALLVTAIGVPQVVAASEQAKLEKLQTRTAAAAKAIADTREEAKAFTALALPRHNEAVALAKQAQDAAGKAQPPALTAKQKTTITSAAAQALKTLKTAPKAAENTAALQKAVQAEAKQHPKQPAPSYLAMSADKAAQLAGITVSTGKPKPESTDAAEKLLKTQQQRLNKAKDAKREAKRAAEKPADAAEKLSQTLQQMSKSVVKQGEAVQKAATKADEKTKQALTKQAAAWQKTDSDTLQSQVKAFTGYVTAANQVIAAHDAKLADQAAENGNATYKSATGKTVGVSGYDVKTHSWVAPAPANWGGAATTYGVGTSTASGAVRENVSAGQSWTAPAPRHNNTSSPSHAAPRHTSTHAPTHRQAAPRHTAPRQAAPRRSAPAPQPAAPKWQQQNTSEYEAARRKAEEEFNKPFDRVKPDMTCPVPPPGYMYNGGWWSNGYKTCKTIIKIPDGYDW